MSIINFPPRVISFCIALSTCGWLHAEDNRVDFDLDDDGLIEINDLQDLDEIRRHLDGVALYGKKTGCPTTGCKGFELTKSLNFDTNGDGQLNELDAYWNDGKGWLPIGKIDNEFKGGFSAIFNGNGYGIENLYINRPGESDLGLFGFVQNGKIKNLNLDGVLSKLIGNESIGALVGISFETTIESCMSSVPISADSRSGGLVGQLLSSKITEGITHGELAVNSVWGGGVVGSMVVSEVLYSYSTGDVTVGDRYAGGIAGSGLQTSNSKIIASYALGTITADSIVGGIVGSNAVVTDSFFAGNIVGVAQVGGVKGGDGGQVTNSYWAEESLLDASHSSEGDAVPLVTLRCPTAANDNGCGALTLYKNWDAHTKNNGELYWSFGNEDDLPTLRIGGVFIDRDGDAIPNETDDFPDNAAASVDDDGDGKPDEWNQTCDITCQNQSGLELDMMVAMQGTSKASAGSFGLLWFLIILFGPSVLFRINKPSPIKS